MQNSDYQVKIVGKQNAQRTLHAQMKQLMRINRNCIHTSTFPLHEFPSCLKMNILFPAFHTPNKIIPKEAH